MKSAMIVEPKHHKAQQQLTKPALLAYHVIHEAKSDSWISTPQSIAATHNNHMHAYHVSHEVSNEAQVSRVHPNPIRPKHSTNLSHQSRSCCFHAIHAQGAAHVIGGDVVHIYEVAVCPHPGEVDAVCLHLCGSCCVGLHNVAPLNACTSATAISGWSRLC